MGGLRGNVGDLFSGYGHEYAVADWMGIPKQNFYRGKV